MQAEAWIVIPRIDERFESDNEYDPTFDATPPGMRERRSNAPAGMKALMLAVLEDGIRCYVMGKGRVRQEAEDWIGSNQRRQPFDFNVICETLDLQPAAVREALQSIREQGNINGRAKVRTRPNSRRSHRLHVLRNVGCGRALASG